MVNKMNSECTTAIGLSTVLRCPVTVLCFAGDVLLCGEGNCLKVYQVISKKLLLSWLVFNTSRIHSIKVVSVWKAKGDSDSINIVCLGGKSASLVNLCVKRMRDGSSNCTCKRVSPVKHIREWLWDCHYVGNHHILENDPENVLLLSAYNKVFNWNLMSNIVTTVSKCKEQCVLYCGHFFTDSHGNQVVASGTVFNQIILWKPLSEGNHKDGTFVNVWKRLHGHEGVIFSITSTDFGRFLLSVSDDRSVRRWDTDSETCLQTLYGHKARVWRAAFFGHYIVSVGEDAQCLLWNEHGTVAKRLKGHKGKSIWSLAVHEGYHLVATGGGDSSIRLWNLDSKAMGQIDCYTITLPTEVTHSLSPEVRLSKESSQIDSARTIGFLSSNELVALTNRGNLQVAICDTDPDVKVREQWQSVLHDTAFASYCAMAVYKERRAIFMGNLTGLVRVMCFGPRNYKNARLTDIQYFQGKVFNLFVDNRCRKSEIGEPETCDLVISGPDGEIVLCLVTFDANDISVVKKQSFQLPFCRHRWVTAVAVLSVNNEPIESRNMLKDVEHTFWTSDVLACGDRRGSLHVFSLNFDKDTCKKDPFQSLIGLHGKTGLTCLRKRGNILYSTGRDGAYQKLKLCFDGTLQILERRRACKGMDWIEGIDIIQDDLWIYGFYMQSYFGIWSVSQNELLVKINCGGGYRSWDLKTSDLDDGVSVHFVYLKGSDIKMSKALLNVDNKSYILQNPLHGREITCIGTLGGLTCKDSKCQVVITGSEDTTVQFLLYNPVANNFTCIQTLEGHIGSVKSLASVRLKMSRQDHMSDHSLLPSRAGLVVQSPASCLQDDWYLLITCGSRTSLKCWKVNLVGSFDLGVKKAVDTDQDSVTGCKVECHLLGEIGSVSGILKRKKKQDDVNDIDDLRFLSVDVLEDFGHSHYIVIAAACSDGFTRIYDFDPEHNRFILLLSNGFHNRCVLVVKFYVVESSNQSRIRKVLLASAGTDGRIAIWDVTTCIQGFLADSKIMPSRKFVTDSENEEDDQIAASESEEEVEHQTFHTVSQLNETFTSGNHLHSRHPMFSLDDQPVLVIQAHQSGINDLAIQTFHTSEDILVLSGGDDNSLSVAHVKLIIDEAKNCKIFLHQMLSEKNAHISSITGVQFWHDDIFCSCSIDQRVKVWKLKEDKIVAESNKDISTTWKLSLKACLDTSVADVSSMAFWRDRSQTFVTVCGVGLEVFTVNDELMQEFSV